MATECARIIVLKSPDTSDDVCWLPDGTKIAFDSNQNIWLANGDGTGQRRLTGGQNPRWSPDGEKILFARGSEHNEVLCVINADGSSQKQITDTSHGYRTNHLWHPDGKRISFETATGMWIVSAQGRDAGRLVLGMVFRNRPGLLTETGWRFTPMVSRPNPTRLLLFCLRYRLPTWTEVRFGL